MWQKLLRDNIRNLKPYVSARSEHGQSEAIFLDANENSMGSVGAKGLNRYPDPLQKALKTKLAKLKNVRPEQIFFGNGSDEAIDILIRSFCEPGRDRIIITPPTYGMYRVCADINNVAVDEAPLNPDFSLDPACVLRTAGRETKMLFLCSPNNPTANLLSSKDIETLLKEFNGMVVIDEAYIDFASMDGWLGRLGQYSNLVVLQTFSKAWGLAGARLGMAYAEARLIAVLTKIKYPYNVNGLTQQAALQALGNYQKYIAMGQQIISARQTLARQLMALPLIKVVFPSDANFLLFRATDAAGLYRHLARDGVFIRDRSGLRHCADCLRVTVGTASENMALIESIKKFKPLG